MKPMPIRKAMAALRAVGTLAAAVIPLSAMLPGAAQEMQSTPSAPSFARELLKAHNHFRAAVRVGPLVWSGDLAASARVWANRLASESKFEHDPGAHALYQGENLFMGTAGFFSLEQMVDAWGEEGRFFHDGTFPNVSTTGSWFDVGHYSQMVWRNTTRVGCAGALGADGYYRLVCRYSPPGNVIGQRVF